MIPVVLSGGTGSRLWPLSRAHYPKQLLALNTDQTLLQETVARFSGVESIGAPIIVCNESHRFLVAEQMRAIDCNPEKIILEPIGRNTAPALTLAAISTMKNTNDNDDAILVVMPADHVIKNQQAFQSALTEAVRLANEDRLVTFGVIPTSPETGYGYIKKGENNSVASFVEKPDLDTAKKYLKQGDYLWNSGMFVVKASVWLNELSKYENDIVKLCREAVAKSYDDLDFLRIETDSFSRCKNISIDYAVMEKTPRAAVVPLEAGWSDIGSWSSLAEVMENDQAGNYIKGDCYTLKTENSYLVSWDRMLAVVGLKDVIVVETADAVLVASKENSQDVKEIVKRLAIEKRSQLHSHTKVFRPWGYYQIVDAGPRFQVKRISVKPGASLSLQRHQQRAEHWVVVRGIADIIRGDENIILNENESTYIPIGMKHRLENKHNQDLEIIEVQSGEYLAEDDIERFEDVYNRD
ncbi:MAG: mannose-1-phosphate guanylyltransferase/mannose-6-phosphate isomerase [Acidiferrobacterales bacterium]